MSQQYHFGATGAVRPGDAPAILERESDAHFSSKPPVAIPELNALALRSLVSLYEAKERLFARFVRVNGRGCERGPTSRRRTIVALLGLQRLAKSGWVQPFDLDSIRDGLLGDVSWAQSAGDIGLLVWLAAAFAPGKLRTLFKEVDLDRVLQAYPDGREARTRGLAWLLAGISHARLSATDDLPDLTDIAVETYHLLVANQGPTGLFGHGRFPSSLRRVCSRRFGTFTDQIHAIYALVQFGKAFQVDEPLESALNCANNLCALQGELGEWWFLYDKRTARVANRYPVLTSHQDGTAPLALLKLTEVTGQSFCGAVYKGLSWLASANAQGRDLRSLDRGLIWDSVTRSRAAKAANYWELGLSLLNLSSGRPLAGRLGVRYEARPDHFGWLLCAFGEAGLPQMGRASSARGLSVITESTLDDLER